MARKAPFDMQTFFQALGDNTRLRLLNLIGDQEVCVCYFVEILGGPQPKISRHLAYLRRAKLVEARREGTWMHYRLAELSDGAASLVRQALTAALKREPAVQKDLAQLKKLTGCCLPAPPAAVAQVGETAPGPQR